MNNAAKATEYKSTVDCDLMYTSYTWYLKKWSMLGEEYKRGVNSEPFDITGVKGKCTLQFCFDQTSREPLIQICWPSPFAFCKMHYYLSFIDTNMKKLHTFQSGARHDFIDGEVRVYMCNARKYSNGEPFILDDTMIILFEVEYGRKVISPITTVDSYEDSGNIVHDNNDLYDDTDFCDIKFVFKETGRTLTAHKHVLAARSPVFRAMFTTDMKELQSGEVTIEDFDDNVFQIFLRYVYTGKLNACDDVISEIMAISSKYQVLSLLDHCERYMCAHIDNKRALSYLITAHQHSVTNLEKRAIAYIKKNLHEVLAQAAADKSPSESLPAVMQLIFSEEVSNKCEAESPVKES